MASETIIIPARFNGPPGSGNGGYVCGLMAKRIAGASAATLRAPPPLEKPLLLTADAGSVTLRDGETLIGEASAAALDWAAPAAPSLEQARAAEARYVGRAQHRYPTCFTCGLDRPAHDGLHLCPGAVEGREMAACAWTPGADLAGGDGRVASEFVHAALDCPTYWALPRAGAMAALLARLASNIDAELPRAGETLIVAAWPISSEGRKHRGAAALYHADGRPIARSEALWIEPRA